MSVPNIEDPVECPLCMEPFEMDDLNFFPCTCGYQICRFCWHRIRTDENGLCPACRKAYPENPADFKPLTPEELQRIKQEKRQKDLQRKQKVTENRKHLSNVRVVQKNLVFVVGLSTRLADPEMLKKSEYFGKFGKMQKVVINHSTTYAGSQGPSASAYVTYQRAEDALRAIQAVNNIQVDGRTLKASLGTTKYCSHFMKNQSCPKPDCMYLHELGDESASFTKEEMQQGKHQEFEKKLQEQYLGSSCVVSDKLIGMGSSCPADSVAISSSPVSMTNGDLVKNSKEIKNSSEHQTAGEDSTEGWPALSVKENSTKRNRYQLSPRQTPTEEHLNKRSKDRERKSQRENNNLKEISKECSDDQGESSDHFLSTTSSSSPESGTGSCTSSTSTTPPPLGLSNNSNDNLAPTPPHPSSSPLPVNASARQRGERDSTNSPTETAPSSLSSCSEFSSSCPISHEIPSLFEPSSIPQSSSSLFSDNSNSFFRCHQIDEELRAREAALEAHRLAERLLISSEYRLDESHIMPSISFPDTLANEEQNIISSDWRRHSLPGSEESVFVSVADPCSNNNTWNNLLNYGNSDIINNLTVIDQKADDELGFDPFEETNKALAEDILIEQEQQQIEKNMLIRQQLIMQQKQREMQMQPGLHNMLDMYSPMSQKEIVQTRLPPPGFNGLSSLGYTSNLTHTHLNKMVPSFMNGSSSQNLVHSSNPLNGLLGTNRLGVPPGLSGNLDHSLVSSPQQNNLHNNLVGNVSGNLQHHHVAGPSLLLEGPLNHPPPGLGHNKQVDPFNLKELENGLNSVRNNMFPSICSVSTMNTVNTLNSIAAANSQNNLPSQNNPLTNFFNLTQQRLHQQQQQQQQHQFTQQNLLHHLSSNILANSAKGWPSGGATDLSALDPAIVSSGQLTDSRSDSPPLWLKSMEQLPNENGPLTPWGSMLPFNLMSGSIGSGISSMVPQSSLRSSMWPPTSPPPGFNSISPLHTKQRESHKIENM